MKKLLLLTTAVVAFIATALAISLATAPRVPPHAMPVFDLQQVRQLAGTGGPVSIRAAQVGEGSMLGSALYKGGPLSLTPMPMFAVELVWPENSILIDPVSDDACAREHVPGGIDADLEAYTWMQQAMLRADAIVATHEHYDHLCGLTSSPHLKKLADKAVLTPEQLGSRTTAHSVSEELRALVEPLGFRGTHALAPGVVLIKAPGHTPGSLWVYVREASGEEFLFVGDTVWQQAALDQARHKPWLTIWGLSEIVENQGRYIRFLHDLKEEEPQLHIVVAHDAPQWDQLFSSDTIERAP